MERPNPNLFKAHASEKKTPLEAAHDASKSEGDRGIAAWFDAVRKESPNGELSSDLRHELIEVTKDELRENGLNEESIRKMEKWLKHVQTLEQFESVKDVLIDSFKARDALRPPPIPIPGARRISEIDFEEQNDDVKAIFKKRFMPSAEQLQEMQDHHKMRGKYPSVPLQESTQQTMIERLDKWIKDQKLDTDGSSIKSEVTEHTLDLADAIEHVRHILRQEAADAGVKRTLQLVSSQYLEENDMGKRAAFTKATFPPARRSTRSPRSRVRSVGMAASVVFFSLFAGANPLGEKSVEKHFDASANSPVATAEVTPGAKTSESKRSTPDTSLKILNVSTEDVNAKEDVSEPSADIVIERPEKKAAPTPVKIEKNVSVWSAALEELGEDGIDLSSKGEDQFADALHQAIEDTNSEGTFIKYDDKWITNVEWEKLPDDAKIYFNRLFENEEFVNRLKELITSKKYSVIASEVGRFGGIDSFMERVKEAFDARI